MTDHTEYGWRDEQLAGQPQEIIDRLVGRIASNEDGVFVRILSAKAYTDALLGEGVWVTARPVINNADLFVGLLEEAMKKEFAFLMGLGFTAANDAWHKAALGIAESMGVMDEDTASTGILVVGIELKEGT